MMVTKEMLDEAMRMIEKRNEESFEILGFLSRCRRAGGERELIEYATDLHFIEGQLVLLMFSLMTRQFVKGELNEGRISTQLALQKTTELSGLLFSTYRELKSSEDLLTVPEFKEKLLAALLNIIKDSRGDDESFDLNAITIIELRKQSAYSLSHALQCIGEEYKALKGGDIQ